MLKEPQLYKEWGLTYSKEECGFVEKDGK